MKRHNNQIILSICIPTYNRGDMLYSLVESILEYDGNDIEVVVVDNASTDNTLLLLSKFNDKRLIVYQNDQNIGARKNWTLSLSKGTGKYLQVINDRDRICTKNIKKFIDVIKDKNYAVICNKFQNAKSEIYNFPESIYHCFMNTHASYFVINRELFRKINDKDAFINQYERLSVSGEYPLATIAMIACTYGSYYWNKNIQIIKLCDERLIKKNPSRSFGDIVYPYFEPSGCKYQLMVVLRFVQYYKSVDININDILPYIYKCQLELATLNFRHYINTEWLNKRYGYKKRHTENIYLINIQFFLSALCIFKRLHIHINYYMLAALFRITLKNYYKVFITK